MTAPSFNFQDNTLVLDMSKFSLKQSHDYSQTPLQPRPIQRVIHRYGNAVNPKRKYIELSVYSIPEGMRMKYLKSRVKGGKIHLKLFAGDRTSQLNRYSILTMESTSIIMRLFISISIKFSKMKMILA